MLIVLLDAWIYGVFARGIAGALSRIAAKIFDTVKCWASLIIDS